MSISKEQILKLEQWAAELIRSGAVTRITELQERMRLSGQSITALKAHMLANGTLNSAKPLLVLGAAHAGTKTPSAGLGLKVFYQQVYDAVAQGEKSAGELADLFKRPTSSIAYVLVSLEKKRLIKIRRSKRGERVASLVDGTAGSTAPKATNGNGAGHPATPMFSSMREIREIQELLMRAQDRVTALESFLVTDKQKRQLIELSRAFDTRE